MKKQVVVIEDDEAINDILCIMLANFGFEVSSIKVGNYFTQKSTVRPHLFIIDRNLPGVDGISICRDLKSQSETRDIPIIIISASSDFVMPAIAAGANDILEKPFSRKELFTKVTKYIDTPITH